MIRFTPKFLSPENKMIADKRNQNPIPDNNPSIKPFGASRAKTTRNKPEIAMASGKTVVALEAISGDCVKPIKKKAIKAVEGSPPMNPPVLLPNLRPANTVKKIQQLPTTNVSNNSKRKTVVIIQNKSNSGKSMKQLTRLNSTGKNRTRLTRQNLINPLLRLKLNLFIGFIPTLNGETQKISNVQKPLKPKTLN